jgi:hypothetical protein
MTMTPTSATANTGMSMASMGMGGGKGSACKISARKPFNHLQVFITKGLDGDLMLGHKQTAD